MSEDESEAKKIWVSKISLNFPAPLLSSPGKNYSDVGERVRQLGLARAPDDAPPPHPHAVTKQYPNVRTPCPRRPRYGLSKILGVCTVFIWGLVEFGPGFYTWAKVHVHFRCTVHHALGKVWREHGRARALPRDCRAQARFCLSARWALNRCFAKLPRTTAVLAQRGGGGQFLRPAIVPAVARLEPWNRRFFPK